MIDFIIAAFITLFTNINIIVPYWDKLRDFYLQQGRPVDEVMKTYYILCAASYIGVAAVVYLIIALIKYWASKH